MCVFKSCQQQCIAMAPKNKLFQVMAIQNPWLAIVFVCFPADYGHDPL